MPKYQILLVDVEVQSDEDAKLVGFETVSHIRESGVILRGLAIRGSDGNALSLGSEQILRSEKDILSAATNCMVLQHPSVVATGK